MPWAQGAEEESGAGVRRNLRRQWLSAKIPRPPVTPQRGCVNSNPYVSVLGVEEIRKLGMTDGEKEDPGFWDLVVDIQTPGFPAS